MSNASPQIIHEDESLLVIDKPVGLAVHPSRHSTETTLADWLISKYPAIKTVGEDPTRPGLVHRLDKETSGVMVVAKNQKAWEWLKKQFHDRLVTKKYKLLVRGVVKSEDG